ncbi:MAG: hypothetical protein WCO26_07745 [Deltaproteobacteria bacterium]
MKSWKIPTSEQVDRTVALLGYPEQYRYFFDRLENPEWIKPLKSKGFFSNPPKPKLDEVNGTIAFPPWPESRYLVRMASLKPDVVLEIILQILDTDNVSVHGDLADAALAMPGAMAAEWIKKEVRWIDVGKRLYFNLPDKLGALIKHLAKAGKVEQALTLTRSLLTVLPDPKDREKDKEDHDETFRLSPEPQARFDLWYYGQILKKYIPNLVTAAGKKSLTLFCNLLETAINLSKRFPEKIFPEDYSYIWRPAIEEHEENLGLNLKDLLVSAVRDAVEQLAKNDPGMTQELVLQLENRDWRIFKRIALHLLKFHSEIAIDLVSDRLTNRLLFEEGTNNHEYVLLIERCFKFLRGEQKEIILGWIEEGPDLETFKTSREQWTGKRPTDDDAKQYKKYWQRDRLAWFRNDLPGNWKERFGVLVAELGEPEHPEFAGRRDAAWVGPTSPKTTEELRSMNLEALVQFLLSWKPTGERMVPSPEGLGRVLSPIVAQDPNRFGAEALKFKELDPTYVRALFSGLREATKQKTAFPWQPVLELGFWVVNQPREIPGRKSEYADLDPGWVWTRKAIAELLSNGFESNDVPIPFDLRLLAWRILRPLTEDPEPAPEDEAKYGGSNMDPVTLSINTTRGEAIHTVIRYALWVRRHIEKKGDGKERVGRGFEEMPEVRDVLDQHLDPTQDPSLAIRAVYGQWFPWLDLLDKVWSVKNITNIFPSDEPLQDMRNAAWEAYIIFCPPYDNVFDVLREEYNRTIEFIGSYSKEKRYLANAEERLAEHLMTFYWRGKLLLDEENGLLDRFFKKASDKLRSHAFDFIGRTLKADKEAILPEIIERLKTVWERRLAVASLSPEYHGKELATFGLWFASAKFDDKWSMDQLVEILKLTRKAEPDHMVIERLVEVCKAFPQQSVECIRLMAEGDKEGWHISGWREQARTILGVALQSSNPDIKAASENVVHYFGKRGYLEFRSLLQK